MARTAPADIRSLARLHTAAAIASLAGIATNGRSESARVAAAAALLDRGWGRPKPDDGEGEQVTIVIRRILEGRVAESSPATIVTLPALEGRQPGSRGQVLAGKVNGRDGGDGNP
jgi:hypothetical protein